jgi:hypothetical protein
VETVAGPVIVLDAHDCALLGRQLVEAIRLGYVLRGQPPPRHLLEFAEQVNAAVRGFADIPASPQVTEPHETAKAAVARSSAASDQPVIRLTADEAAKIAGMSVQHMRACLRRGEPQGSREGYQGAWRVDSDELAAWLSQKRRKENDRKAA